MSQLEETLAYQMRLVQMPVPEREYEFCPGRRWRFDFAFVPQKLAVECEGAVWQNGRHTRGSGFTKDMEKYNRATLLGWRLLRYDAQAIKSGRALNEIEVALAGGVKA